MTRGLGIGLVLAAAIALAGTALAGTDDARDHVLLGSVLAGMKTDLVSVRIGNLTPAWRAPSRRHERLLAVTSRATTPAGRVLDEWDATLIAGAYNDQCGRRADHCLAVYELTGAGGGGIGRSGAHRPFGSRPMLSRKIRARFATLGLRVSSISYQRPDAFAPEVTVTSRHPQQAVTAYRAAVFSRLHVAGFFVRMVDGRGHLFFVAGGSGDNGEAWARPGLKLPNVP